MQVFKIKASKITTQKDLEQQIRKLEKKVNELTSWGKTLEAYELNDKVNKLRAKVWRMKNKTAK